MITYKGNLTENSFTLYKNNELIDTFIFNTNKIIIIKFNIPTTKYYLEEYNPKCHNIDIDMDYCFVIITNIINNIKINNFKSLNRACVNDGSYIGLFNKYNILQEYKFELPDIYFTCLIYSNYINIKKYNELIYTDIDDNSANISNIFNNIFISCDSLINELEIQINNLKYKYIKGANNLELINKINILINNINNINNYDLLFAPLKYKSIIQILDYIKNYKLIKNKINALLIVNN
jgi:hypothetical protein